MKTKILKILSLTFIGISAVSCSKVTNLLIKENANDLVQNETTSITSDEILLNKAISYFYDNYSYEFLVEYRDTGIPEIDKEKPAYQYVEYDYTYQKNEKEEIHYGETFVIMDGQRIPYTSLQVFYDDETGCPYVENLEMNNTITKTLSPASLYSLVSPFSLLNPSDFEKSGEYYVCTNEIKFSFMENLGIFNHLLGAIPMTDLQFKIENNHFVSATGNVIMSSGYGTTNKRSFKMPFTLTFKYDNLQKLEHLTPLSENEDQKKLTQAFKTLADSTFTMEIQINGKKYKYFKAEDSAFMMSRTINDNENALANGDIWLVDYQNNNKINMIEVVDASNNVWRVRDNYNDRRNDISPHCSDISGTNFDYKDGVYTLRNILKEGQLINYLIPSVFKQLLPYSQSSYFDVKVKLNNNQISEISAGDYVFKLSSIGTTELPFNLDISNIEF